MAKQFAGFNEQQKNIILARNGYKGRPLQNDEALNLIASDPKYNSAYNMAYKQAMKLVPGARAMARPMATGGFVFPSKDARGTVNRLKEIDNPEYADSAVKQQNSAVNQMQQTFSLPQNQMQQPFVQPQDQMRPPRGFAEGGATIKDDMTQEQKDRLLKAVAAENRPAVQQPAFDRRRMSKDVQLNTANFGGRRPSPDDMYNMQIQPAVTYGCLLYTSEAADE